MTTNEKDSLIIIDDIMNLMFWGKRQPHLYQNKNHCDRCAEEHAYGFGLNE